MVTGGTRPESRMRTLVICLGSKFTNRLFMIEKASRVSIRSVMAFMACPTVCSNCFSFNFMSCAIQYTCRQILPSSAMLIKAMIQLMRRLFMGTKYEYLRIYEYSNPLFLFHQY